MADAQELDVFCEACGKEITGFYARFKKVGSEEYMSFHVDNERDREESCWGIWMKQNLNTHPQPLE